MSTAIELKAKIDKLNKNKQVPTAMKEKLLKKYNAELSALIANPIDPGKGAKNDDKTQPRRVKKSADDVPVKKSKTKPKYKEGQEVYCSPHAEVVTIETIKGWDAEIGQNEYTVKFHDGKTQTFGEAELAGNKKAKAKKKRSKHDYKFKNKDIKTLTRDECDELHKEVANRRANQKKAEKKSKSKPVVEKVASSVVKGAKHVIKNVSAADIKDDPKGEIDKMKKFIELTRKYIADSRALLGDDYDKETVDGEVKELRDMVKALEKKYK